MKRTSVSCSGDKYRQGDKRLGDGGGVGGGGGDFEVGGDCEGGGGDTTVGIISSEFASPVSEDNCPISTCVIECYASDL